MPEINTSATDVEHAIGYITPRIMTAVDRHPEDRELRQALEMLNSVRFGAPSPVDPDDYYTRLAVHLHQVADGLAALAGCGLAPLSFAYLSLNAGLLKSQAPKAIPVVDAIVDALGLPAPQKIIESSTAKYDTRLDNDSLDIHVSAAIPHEDPRDAEIARLKGQLANLEQRDAAATAVFPAARPQPDHAEVTNVADLPRLVEPAPLVDPALLDPDTPLDDLPADFGDDHRPSPGCCQDCDDELDLTVGGVR
jgi:hypothetical protein